MEVSINKRAYRSRSIETHLNNVIFVIDDSIKIVMKVVDVNVIFINVITIFEDEDDKINLSKRFELDSRLICY